MEHNEQYFHYRQVEIRLALARANCTKDGLQIARSIFLHFFETCHGSSGCIRWKFSLNARLPHALPPVFGPNDDTLNALILFALLEKQHVLFPFCMYCELIGATALSQELVSPKELKTL